MTDSESKLRQCTDGRLDRSRDPAILNAALAALADGTRSPDADFNNQASAPKKHPPDDQSVWTGNPPDDELRTTLLQ